MSLLDVGTGCATCALADFLPFTCPGCERVFCREHVQGHDCSQPQIQAGPSRKRLRGTCAFGECKEETIESVGGLEGAAEDNVARQVRCVCGGAFCVKHRSQEAHECTAPRALSARQDAQIVRRDKAAEVMAKHFPTQAGKERIAVPKQVDRTRTGSPPRLNPSSSTVPNPAPAPNPAILTANDKLYKLHQTKTRSLARPLDAKVPRDESAALEFVVDEGGSRVRAWLAGGGKYAPMATGVAIGTGKPERIWVPHAMPGGKLFDTLVARAKMSRAGLPLAALVISLRPDAPRAATPLDLTLFAGEQVASGDAIVLVRGWE
ncbi:hypothetical protein CspHIS471_0404860 [Cutaneotrichosporon sp. HIS471]|nr:hypothetical protein CspHIS471_0404860 [Cutaneotrichosporon sp. HIS471]